MTIEQAETRLRAVVGLAEAADDEDVMALDTLLNEIDRLKEDVRTAGRVYKEERRKNVELGCLLRGLMKYMIGDD